MIGKYGIEIYNNKIHYEFEVKRNITIIQGDSATGKTTLIDLIADYGRLGKGSGITLKCDKDCLVLPAARWKEFIRDSHECIIFVEENLPFIKSKEFAESVNYSDNYFVIVFRDSLPALAYSIEEIYGIREDRNSQKYVNAKRVYNSFYNIYNVDDSTEIEPDVVVTEDSNSGYEFFDRAFSCECIPSDGKSKVHKVMAGHADKEKTVLGIVDGAAFGADMQKLMKSITDKKGKCYLYAPESFEYLLLKTGIFDNREKELNETYNYADSIKYASWEQYYTDQLHNQTQGTDHQYSKKHLGSFYHSDRCVNAIKKIMKRIKF